MHCFAIGHFEGVGVFSQCPRLYIITILRIEVTEEPAFCFVLLVTHLALIHFLSFQLSGRQESVYECVYMNDCVCVSD